jgi:EAL and modified HD-GYP domain-containing signal transduction protein
MSRTATPKRAASSVFVARQPIFDAEKNAWGYELLFRSGLENVYDGTDGNQSTLEVVASSSVVIGFDELGSGRRCFMNFTRDLLLQDIVALLPPDLVVVEILEDIEPDALVLAACRKLSEAGYLLALDDFVLDHADSPFLDFADIVKVDFAGTTPDERVNIAADLQARGTRALAEKVETLDQFNAALHAGYSLFQGYFFSKPVICAGKSLSGSKLSYVQMLREVNRPELSYDDLEATIKRDVSLTYKLLRFINSVWFALRHEVASIKHALVLLGPKEIRKWFALVALRHMGDDKPAELLVRAMVRARMAELLAPDLGHADDAQELFLMGMFSVIDAILDAPMDEIVEKLPLDERIRHALLGEPGPFRTLLDMIAAYERADWEAFAERAAQLGLDERRVPPVFADALKWATQAFEVV